MSKQRFSRADGAWTQDGYVDEPIARCSDCQRLTWDEGMVGMVCYMPRPNGDRCPGKLNRLTTTQRAYATGLDPFELEDSCDADD